MWNDGPIHHDLDHDQKCTRADEQPEDQINVLALVEPILATARIRRASSMVFRFHWTSAWSRSSYRLYDWPSEAVVSRVSTASAGHRPYFSIKVNSKSWH